MTESQDKVQSQDRVLGAERDVTSVRRPQAAFALLGTVQVTLLMAMMVIAVALPTIQRELGLDGAQLALVNSAYPVSFCGLLLLGGRLGDVFGHRRAFMWGTAIFAVGSAATALAAGFGLILLARFGQGIGAALATPAAMGLLGPVFPERRAYARAMAVWGGLPIIGGVVGLLLSGPIVSWASWRWAFLPPVLIAIAAVALAPALLPGVRPATRQRVDVAGALLVTAGLAATCYSLEEAGEGASSSIVVPSACLGVLLLVAFVFVEARRRNPLLPVVLLASVRRLAALACIASGAAAVFSLSFFLPLYFQQTYGFSPVATSAAYLPYALMMFLTSSFSGRLVARMGPRATTIAGFVIGSLGLFLLSTMGTGQPYFGPILAGMITFPLGAVLIFSGTTVVIMEGVPAEHAGVAGGLLNATIELGPTIGFAALVSIAASWTAGLLDAGIAPEKALPGGYGAALTIAAVVYLAIALSSLIYIWRQSSRRRS
jgi:MFS family permease